MFSKQGGQPLLALFKWLSQSVTWHPPTSICVLYTILFIVMGEGELVLLLVASRTFLGHPLPSLSLYLSIYPSCESVILRAHREWVNEWMMIKSHKSSRKLYLCSSSKIIKTVQNSFQCQSHNPRAYKHSHSLHSRKCVDKKVELPYSHLHIPQLDAKNTFIAHPLQSAIL